MSLATLCITGKIHQNPSLLALGQGILHLVKISLTKELCIIIKYN